ncbi:MAG: hypothetical protein ACP5IX_00915 [Patescibacteria group bacterium]
MNYQDYVETFTNQAKSVNLVTPTWDLFIFMFFVGAVLLFVFSLSRDKLLITLLSTYTTIALINSVSFLENIYKDTLPFYLWKIIIFIVLLILFSILISRAIGLSQYTFGSIRQIVIFSILQVGLLMSIIFSFLPIEFINYLSPLTKNIFVSNLGKTFWLILPIISLIFIRRK